MNRSDVRIVRMASPPLRGETTLSCLTSIRTTLTMETPSSRIQTRVYKSGERYNRLRRDNILANPRRHILPLRSPSWRRSATLPVRLILAHLPLPHLSRGRARSPAHLRVQLGFRPHRRAVVRASSSGMKENPALYRSLQPRPLTCAVSRRRRKGGSAPRRPTSSPRPSRANLRIRFRSR